MEQRNKELEKIKLYIFSIVLLILAHLSGPPLAYAPVQREYRVKMLQQRVDRLLKWKLKGIMRGWKLDGDKNIWR